MKNLLTKAAVVLALSGAVLGGTVVAAPQSAPADAATMYRHCGPGEWLATGSWCVWKSYPPR